MIIAYCLYAKDNKGKFFDNAPPNIFCPSCRSCLDKNYIPNHFNPGSKGYDVSFSLDSRLIISERFKNYCEQLLQIQDIDFHLINKLERLYFMLPTKLLYFDSVRRKTRFENLCNSCNSYESIIGATPAFLKDVSKPIQNGIYRSDIEFGSDFEKFPLIIVGVQTKNQIEIGGFTGDIYFKPIEAS